MVQRAFNLEVMQVLTIGFRVWRVLDGLFLAVLDKEGDTSILKTKEASYVNGKLVLSSYLDKYPFPLYILLSHVEALPEILADALRQWFELLQRQAST